MESASAAVWAGARKATKRWKYNAKHEVESSPVVSETRVFTAAGRKIFALDRQTGKKLWTFKTQSQVLASGVLAGDMFMVGCDDKYFYALGQETGDLRWKFSAGEFTGGAAADAERQVVYVGSSEGFHAYGFDGKERFTLTKPGAVNSSPAIDEDGNVIFGDDKGRVWKVNPKGEVLWSYKFNEGVRSPIVITKEDGLLLSTGDPDGNLRGTIVRMSPDGMVVWRAKCAGGKHQCYSCWTAPQPVGDVVVAGCGLDTMKKGSIWGVSRATGELRWEIKADNDCQTSSPVHLGDGKTVVLGCTDGTLYAVDALEGKTAWTFKGFEKGIWATPAMDNDGVLYVASHDGQVLALVPGSEGEL